MCGICGELRFDGQPVRLPAVTAMRDQLLHRGPDAFGAYLSPDSRAALGFRRLRIIDLSANANQPMPNETGSVQVVFNGEIYNFQELRRDLEQRGHEFRSHSDTEVIAHLYEEKGADAIACLDGMFAIAIWDERARRLLLARDRAGKKPLFHYRNARLMAFASEIKAFFVHPDIAVAVAPETVPQYFIHGYVPGPETFYRDVRQVPPGSLMVVEADGRSTTRTYWHLEFPREGAETRIDETTAAGEVRALVTRAVSRRLVSDVPLGAFLSGGIDSTIVVGLMARLSGNAVKTFTVGFDGDAAYDETTAARAVASAFHTDHTEFRVAPSAIDLIDPLIWHHDGPFGDSSAVPTYLVSRLTRDHVTVVLTGDGGDELFAGYDRFYAALVSERLPRWAGSAARALLRLVPPSASDRHWSARALRFARPLGRPLDERITSWNSTFFDDLPALLRPDFAAELPPIDRLQHIAPEQPRLAGRSALARMLHVNYTSYLADDLLVKVDRCTMANSIEARSPLLDTALTDFVAALPDAMKLRGRRTKVVLRRAFADLIPPEIAARRKMGFGVPVGTWFRGELRTYIRDLLLAPDARYCDMLDRQFVEALLNGHLEGHINAGPQLWTLMCFERWLRLLPEWTRRAAAA